MRLRTSGIDGAMIAMLPSITLAQVFLQTMSRATRQPITTSMELMIYQVTERGRAIPLTASAGSLVLARTGHLIDKVNGCGYRPRVGHGSRASHGVGLLITTGDGLTCRE